MSRRTPHQPHAVPDRPAEREPSSLRSYNPESTAQWCREIAGLLLSPAPTLLPSMLTSFAWRARSLADEIKSRLKTELELPRYKFVVQVVIGEQRGEGVRMGCRCFWDPDTDAYAEETYRNVSGPTAFEPPTYSPTASRRSRGAWRPLPVWQDSLFCVAAAFGSYLY